MVHENDCKGIKKVDERSLCVNILLYADDLLIVGEQVNRAQKISNVLLEICTRLGL